MNGRTDTNLLNILYEDDDLLVVNKPAGLVCHPTKTDCLSSLIARLRVYFGYCPLQQDPAHCACSPNPDKVCPWHTELDRSLPSISFINRLDRETSGVMLTTKTPEAAATMAKLMREGGMQKTYQAIVHGIPSPTASLIDQPLGDDEQSAVIVKDCVRRDGTPAQTVYRLVKSFEHEGSQYSLLNVYPGTGRKHQIRIHLSWMGCPIVGDKLYGGNEQYYLDLIAGRLSEKQKRDLILPYQALHAQSLSFTTHDGHNYHFTCEPEPWFKEFASLAK